jgi:hypothetical protein
MFLLFVLIFWVDLVWVGYLIFFFGKCKRVIISLFVFKCVCLLGFVCMFIFECGLSKFGTFGIIHDY